MVTLPPGRRAQAPKPRERSRDVAPEGLRSSDTRRGDSPEAVAVATNATYEDDPPPYWSLDPRRFHLPLCPSFLGGFSRRAPVFYQPSSDPPSFPPQDTPPAPLPSTVNIPQSSTVSLPTSDSQLDTEDFMMFSWFMTLRFPPIGILAVICCCVARAALRCGCIPLAHMACKTAEALHTWSQIGCCVFILAMIYIAFFRQP